MNYYWIFLFLETFFDFIFVFGDKGNGEWSPIITCVGFILFIITFIVSFFIAGWKIAVLVFITYFLIGKTLNNLFVNKIFNAMKKL